MSHTIADLRAHLFATLGDLRDKEKPLDIERAKAISEVAQTIINTAKVEVDHMRVSGQAGSGFLSGQHAPALPAPDAVKSTTTQGGRKTVQTLANGATLTRHRMS